MSNLFNAIILFVCIAIMVGAFAFTLDEVGLYLFGLKWPLHCLLNHLFGIKCALCGMTRSFTAMADGDLAGAFAYHRLGPVLFFLVLFQIPYRIWALAASPKKVGKRFRRIHAGLVALVLTAVMVNWLIYLGGRLL